MSVDPHLLEILACPDTHHAPLRYDEPAQTLTCTECHRVFEIRAGIPVLLLDEAIAGPGTGPAGGAQPPGATGAPGPGGGPGATGAPGPGGAPGSGQA